MRPLICALLAILGITLGACHQQAEAPDRLAVDGVVIRLPAVEGRPAALYFTLHGGPKADRLVAITSSKAATIELHESSMQNGVMSMHALTGTDLPAKGTIAFAPGGNHAMAYGVDPAITPGGAMPVSFVFQSGASVAVSALAIGAGDEMPADHDMASNHDHR